MPHTGGLATATAAESTHRPAVCLLQWFHGCQRRACCRTRSPGPHQFWCCRKADPKIWVQRHSQLTRPCRPCPASLPKTPVCPAKGLGCQVCTWQLSTVASAAPHVESRSDAQYAARDKGEFFGGCRAAHIMHHTCIMWMCPLYDAWPQDVAVAL